MYINRLLASAVTLSILSTLGFPLAQAAPQSKKITLSQVERKFTTAAEKTIKWQNTNPFSVSIVTNDNSERTVDTYTIDRNGNVRVEDIEGALMIEFGKDSYVPFTESTFLPFELEIAHELELDTKVKWAKVPSVTVNDEYDPNFSRDQARSLTQPSTNMIESVYPNRSTATSAVNGKSETVKVLTKAFTDSNWGAVPSSTITFVTVSGILTSYSFKSNGVTTSITYKPFKTLLSPPTVPILDWYLVFNHPEYYSRSAAYNGQIALDWLLEEAKAVAVLGERTEPIAEDWAKVMQIASYMNAELFDKGVGFLVYDERRTAYPMCGEFTTSAPLLRTSSCDALGFVKV
jgi:hypothetical protein